MEIRRQSDPWRPSPFHEESRATVFDTRRFQAEKLVPRPRGLGSFSRVVIHEKHGDRLAMLPVLDDGWLVMVEQYRIPMHRWTLEIPSGHAKDDGDPVDALRLMLRRKAGHQADEMTQVFRFINDPSDSTQYTTIFQASGLHEVELLKEGAADPANPYGWHGNTKGRPRAAKVQGLPFSVPNAPSS